MGNIRDKNWKASLQQKWCNTLTEKICVQFKNEYTKNCNKIKTPTPYNTIPNK